MSKQVPPETKQAVLDAYRTIWAGHDAIREAEVKAAPLVKALLDASPPNAIFNLDGRKVTFTKRHKDGAYNVHEATNPEV